MNEGAPNVEAEATVEVGPMVPSDIPFVLRVLAITPGVTSRDADSQSSLEIYLSRNPGLSLIARVAGSFAGFVLSGHDGRRGYLHHLLVLPEHRRRGVGRYLVAAATEELRRIGSSKIHVDVLSDNTDAQTFWIRLGWVHRPDLRKYSSIVSGGANA